MAAFRAQGRTGWIPRLVQGTHVRRETARRELDRCGALGGVPNRILKHELDWVKRGEILFLQILAQIGIVMSASIR
jgi:hypothetical protein